MAELAAAFAEAVDARLPNNMGRTDLGEMAQMAAVEALASTLAGRARNLFDAATGDIRRELARLATPSGFGTFAKAFFGRFIYKCLDYYLSRTLANHVGEGRRFTWLARQEEFSEGLERHCLEAARYVEKFCRSLAFEGAVGA